MQNYNYIQKILHDLVLGNKIINKTLFELEKIFFLKNNYETIKINHVFISSLPRSGTTSLLNFAYSTGEFGSLKYNNMPFILSPNISKLFNVKEKKITKKRIHNDGIYYNLDSPESLDEVFFCNKNSFIKEELLNYINLILIAENKKRYLSKNNLNYKRIELISSIFPNAIFIIPIRDPLQQSYSMYQQHLNFCKIHNNDDFTRRYMSYLYHNEFGINHNPWNKPVFYNNPNEFNYWLEQWFLFYKNLFEVQQYNKKCFFITYEKLSNQGYLDILVNYLNLTNINNLNFFKNSNKHSINIEFDNKIYVNAYDIYSKIAN